MDIEKDQDKSVINNSNNSSGWTEDAKERLNEYIKSGMAVSEISKELNKTESSIRFQLKMSVYNEMENGKIKDMTYLIDGTKIQKNSQYTTKNLYNDANFINMIIVYNYLDAIKNQHSQYTNLYDQVKKECMDKLKEITKDT